MTHEKVGFVENFSLNKKISKKLSHFMELFLEKIIVNYIQF